MNKFITMLSLLSLTTVASSAEILRFEGDGLSNETYALEKCGLDVTFERNNNSIVVLEATEYITTNKFERTHSSDSILFEKTYRYQKGLTFTFTEDDVTENENSYFFSGKNGKHTLILRVNKDDGSGLLPIGHEVEKKKIFGKNKRVHFCGYHNKKSI